MRRLLGYRAVAAHKDVRPMPSQGSRRWRSGRPSAVLVPLALLCVLMGLGAAGCALSSQATAPRTTPTPTVYVTPTATPTALDALILGALGSQAQTVTTAPGTGAGSLVVTITISGTVPGTQADIVAAQERVKTLCYQALYKLVTSGMASGEVTIVVLGPLLDEYANRVNDVYGSAIIEPRTAARLDWAQLTADSAWPLYDHVYLRNYFYPVD